jgi:hypothetical protein
MATLGIAISYFCPFNIPTFTLTPYDTDEVNQHTSKPHGISNNTGYHYIFGDVGR